MGDYRITIEGVGNHGCGRESKDGELVKRCGDAENCVECAAIALVEKLHLFGQGNLGGASSVSATVEHWPARNRDGSRRRDNGSVGPVDDLLTGIRRGSFGASGDHGCLTGTDGEPKQHAPLPRPTSKPPVPPGLDENPNAVRRFGDEG